MEVAAIPKLDRFVVRKDVMIMDRNLAAIAKNSEVKLSDGEKKTLKDELKKVRKITDYSPRWVILMISVSLGLGTMIGWKRIVRTIRRKDRKRTSYLRAGSECRNGGSKHYWPFLLFRITGQHHACAFFGDRG